MYPTSQPARSPCSEDDPEADAGERTSLRTRKRKVPRCCLVKSKLALTFLTRLVFMLVTLFSAGVITTSIWFMLDCRSNFSHIRPLLPTNTQFCTNMGMPALFACCIVLFTVFGLGCTGRRLTGYALIIISSVQMLQSITTLTFYKCNTLDVLEVEDAVNSSILTCHRSDSAHLPLAFTAPFVQIAPPMSSKAMSQADNDKHIKPTPRTSRGSTSRLVKGTSGEYQRFQRSVTQPLRKIRHVKRKLLKRIYNEIPTDQPPLVNEDTKDFAILSTDKLTKVKKSLQHSFTQTIECSKDSPYFQNLASTAREDLSECVQVCQTYRSVCEFSSKTSLVSGVGSIHKNFEAKVRDCGDQVYEHVNNLCYYDNQIIIPLSLCAPMFYIALSACFIYLTYCDRRLKEDGLSNIVLHSPKDSSSLPWTWRILSWCRGPDFSKRCVLYRYESTKSTGGSSWDGILPYSRSQSTSELLQLRTMPSTVTLSCKMSTEPSQCTLVTTASDESPSVPAPASV